MCTTCGCGVSEVRTHGHAHDHPHHHAHDQPHGHHHHDHDGSTPELRRIAVEQALFAKNDRLAAANRHRLAGHGIVAFNLVSSPGAGKTSLLVRTLTDLGARMPIAVVEGDQATDLDARRIKATGAPAVQVNTGPGCHLDAGMVAHALEHLDLPAIQVLFIENVGNLVCPAPFDLGEAAKIVVVSVTEGDDKPLKYPDMFAAASLMVVTKTDLLAHVPASLDRLVDNATRVNPGIETMALSSHTGVGLGVWYRWIETKRWQARRAAPVRHAVPA